MTPDRSVGSQLVWSYGGYAARIIYLALLVPFYGRILGPIEYGKLLAAMALLNTVWLIAAYGFQIGGMRAVATTPNPADQEAVLASAFTGRWFSAAAALITGLVMVTTSPVLRQEAAMSALAVGGGVIMAFNLGWYFQGKGRHDLSTAFEVLFYVSILVPVLLFVHKPENAWIPLASFVSAALIVLTLSYSWALPSRNWHRHLNIHKGWAFLKKCTPLFFASGFYSILMGSITVLLTSILPAAQLGAYGVAERVSTICLSLLLPVSQVMIGRVSQKLQDDPDPASAFRLVRRTMQLAMVSGGALSAMIIGLAPWIINTVFGAGFSGSIDILRVFALMFPLAVFTEVVRMHILVPHLKDKQVTAISLTGALLHIVGTLWLSAQYGAIGAAWSRVGVEVFMATLSTYFIHRAGLLQRVWPSPLT